MKFDSLEAVRQNDPTVHNAMRAGQGLEAIIVALANQKQELMAKVLQLETIAPRKITMDGRTWIWRCPDHMVPDSTNSTE